MRSMEIFDMRNKTLTRQRQRKKKNGRVGKVGFVQEKNM